jgi:enoyl-CoA hydratase/carnithine racemase
VALSNENEADSPIAGDGDDTGVPIVRPPQPLRPPPTFRTVLLRIDGGVATITLNRPNQRNAIGDGMREELADAYRYCNDDDSVRAIVLTGTPPAFCAGADLSDGEATFTAPGPDFSAAGIDVPAWTLSKPVIAAINGHAIGLGLTLALQCDIRFFAADAKYGVVQVRRGVVGDAYSHWILPRLVGIATAAEILLTGATFDGHRAIPLGLGSRVLDADQVLPAALALASDIAENTAPMSVAASKRLLWDSFELDRAAVGARETGIHLKLMGHDDAREGVRAFVQGRAPRWTGVPADPTRG